MARTSVDTSAAITAEESQKCIAGDMDYNASPKPSGLPLSKKLCYAVGGAPYQMTINAKGFFLQIFLLDVVQMGAFPTSLILFLGRAWDAISDPLVGYVVSKSRKTRIGKLIPWIVFSTPLGIVSYIMLWCTPQKTMSPTFSFTWYFTMCCLFDTFMSCYHVPYSSLNMFLGGSQKDRDSATGYRMGVEVLSTLAGAGIQGQIVGVYHAKKAHACSQLNNSEFSQHNISSGISDTLQETRRAYVIAAVIMGMLYLLCCMVLFLGVKEQLAPLSTLDRLRMPYLTCLKMVVNHTPYTWLVFGFLFSSLAFQMAQGNFALFNTHVAGLGAYFQHLVLILLSASTLSIPVWQMLLLRLGKKTTIFIGLSIYIPTLIIIASVKTHLPTYILMSILAGSSLAALYLLPCTIALSVTLYKILEFRANHSVSMSYEADGGERSMLPDVVDDFKVKHPTCKDLEPMFYSCFVFFNKFGGGVSVGISTLALYFVGYEPGACKHNDRVISMLRILFAPVPIVLLLVGMLLFYFYPINEERRQQTQRELEEAVKGNANFDQICIEATPDPSKSSPN